MKAHILERMTINDVSLELQAAIYRNEPETAQFIRQYLHERLADKKACYETEIGWITAKMKRYIETREKLAYEQGFLAGVTGRRK